MFARAVKLSAGEFACCHCVHLTVRFRAMNISPDQFQLGRSKIFIKNPESLFMLEESRERRYDQFARVLQKAFRRFTAVKRHAKEKEEACQLVYGGVFYTF